MKKYSVYYKVSFYGNNLTWKRSFHESIFGGGKGNYKTADGARRAAKRYKEKMQKLYPNAEWVVIEEER